MLSDNMRKDNVTVTVKDGLCMGCGVCEDICPQHCISIQKGRLNVPQVNDKDCVDCGLCRKVCAGRGIEIEERAKELFGATPQYDKMLGHYIKTYKGYSTEYENRFHCASGGCLSQFLIWLLERGEIDGAVVTGYESNSPMQPRVYIARNRKEVLEGKSSKYCVVTMNGIAKEIHNTPGKYVVVGLPCHIHAFRKYSSVDKKVGERIIGYFPIFCSSNKNMDSQKYMRWRYKINEDELAEFAYRDEGCLGSVFFRDKNRNSMGGPIEYLDFYRGIRAFFSVPRCAVCSDFYGELGDIGFGDLNNHTEDDDPIGINSLITRSAKWDALLNQCAEEGHLWLEEIGKEKMLRANNYCMKKKGAGMYAARNIRKWTGKKNPEFDNLEAIKPSAKAYVGYLAAVVQRFIGRHEVLWPIIKKLDKNKKN